MSGSKHYYCVNCLEEIKEVLFSCDQCKDFDLCLQCTVCGVEIGEHVTSHPLRMLDLGTFTIFNVAYSKRSDSNKVTSPSKSSESGKHKFIAFPSKSPTKIGANEKQTTTESSEASFIEKDGCKNKSEMSTSKKVKEEIKKEQKDENFTVNSSDDLQLEPELMNIYDSDGSFDSEECTLEFHSDVEVLSGEEWEEDEVEPQFYYCLENRKLERRILKTKSHLERDQSIKEDDDDGKDDDTAIAKTKIHDDESNDNMVAKIQESGSDGNRDGSIEREIGATPRRAPLNRWRALDELALLEAMAQHGHEKWDDVQRSMQLNMPGITATECSDHYALHYILTDVGDYCLEWKNDTERLIHLREEFTKMVTLYIPPAEEYCDDLTQSELDIIGYMPMRNDFEREFDNDAESLIANLTVSPNQDEIERRYNLAQIQLYQLRLIERFRKKAIFRLYNLVRKFILHHRRDLTAQQLAETAAAQKALEVRTKPTSKASKQSMTDDGAIPGSSVGKCASALSQVPATPELCMKKITSDEEISSCLAPWLYFVPKINLQDVYLRLTREYVIKSAILNLLSYRKLGCTKLADIREFEENRKKMKKCENDDSTPMETDADSQKQQQQKVKSSNDILDHFPDLNRLLDKENLRRLFASFVNDKILFNILDQVYFPEDVAILDSTFAVDHEKRQQPEKPEKVEKEKCAGGANKTPTPTTPRKAVATARRQTAAHKSTIVQSPKNEKFDVTSFSGYRALSLTERDLCNELKLRPTTYSTLKSSIIKEYQRSPSKNLRFPFPFSPTDTTNAFQNDLQNTLHNLPSGVLCRVANRVNEFLLSNEIISKDLATQRRDNDRSRASSSSSSSSNTSSSTNHHK